MTVQYDLEGQKRAYAAFVDDLRAALARVA
jgi:hypothetical protein